MDLHDATAPEEGGEARRRMAMVRAERTHRRRRGYTVIAGAIAAALAVAGPRSVGSSRGPTGSPAGWTWSRDVSSSRNPH
jgi:hypothetical protein